MSAGAGPRARAVPAAVPPGWRHRAARRAVAALLAAGTLGGAACQAARDPSRQGTQPVMPAAAPLGPGEFRLTGAEMRRLRIEPVRERDIRPERLIEGRIAYDEEGVVPVFSPYAGARVLRVLAHAGDAVHRGDTLFELESAELLQAESGLLARADAVEKARAALGLARSAMARQRVLLRVRAASQRDLERSEAEEAHAAAELRSAEAALAAAQARLGVLGRSPPQVEALVAARHPNAVVAVTAPIDGTVVQRRLGPGQWLGAEAVEPAYTVADLSTMWLIGMVREADAAALQPGQRVEAVVDALPGRVFEARITRLASSIDPLTRRLEACAELQVPDGALKPGMRASLRVALGEARRAVSVPEGALLARGAEAAVWLVQGEDRIGLRRVRLGSRVGDEVEIVEGLTPGERIVTGGALFLDHAQTA